MKAITTRALALAFLAATLPATQGSAAAAAEEEAQDAESGPGSEALEKLKRLYAEGRKPAPEELDGWFAGRAIFDSDPDQAVAMLLATVPPDVDPLFKSRRFLLAIRGRGDAARFDRLSRRETSRLLRSIQVNTSGRGAVRFTSRDARFHFRYDTLWETGMRESGEPSAGEFKLGRAIRRADHSIRKSGDYLVMKMDYGGDTGYAYFFKRLTPR